MTIEKIEHTVIKASPGKVFLRILDNRVFGNEITLGYTSTLNDKELITPIMELPSFFIEIDDPELIINKTEIE